MEKNSFKMRISNMLRLSYAICSSKKIKNDVLEKPQNLKPQNLQHFQLIQFFSPRARGHPFHSLYKPKICPEIFQTQENLKLNTKFPPRSKISERQHLLHPSEYDIDFLKCPPVSPLNSFECKKGRKFKNKTRKSRSRSKTFDILEFQGYNYNGLFSSDEDKTMSFFSSRSLSVSSESTKRNNPRKTKKSGTSCRRNGAAKKEAERKGTLNLGESFAVVKNSSDPYNDFRTSMVEMIVEKNILSTQDLEKMLVCFLSLNSNHHHQIIIEVFTEILEALFSTSY